MTRAGNNSFVRSQSTIKQMRKDAESIKRQQQANAYKPFTYPTGDGENESYLARMQELNRK